MIELIAIYCGVPDACTRTRLSTYSTDQACIEQLINLNSGATHEYFEEQHVRFECTRNLKDKP